jgi:hypothetical protein
MPPYKLSTDAERFLSKVNRRGPKMPHMTTRCWLWTGSLANNGYGQMSIGSRAQGTFHMVGTHRFALALHLGRPIRPGMFALHRCDNKPCVRDDHLWEGTTQENTADREAKGRGAKGERNRGFAHPERLRGIHRYNAAFTDDDVRAIRSRVTGGESQAAIAREYGVRSTAIFKLVHRESWKHVA